jgi:tetratricopeptide (TPR) repeat protein
MIGDISLTELFDRYLEDDLNVLDRQEFEQRLAQDPAFARRFKLHKEVDAAVMESDIMQFRRQLETIGAENEDLLRTSPMEVVMFPEPEVNLAIMEQDVIALRNQLNKIHTGIMEELEAERVPGYAGIDDAIINQDALALQNELKSFIERRESGDPQLQSNDNLDIEIDKAIMQEEVMELRNKLVSISEKVTGVKVIAPQKTNVLTMVTRAAAVLVFLVAGGIFLLQMNNSSTSGMFDNYVSRSASRGPAVADEKIVNVALGLYEKGEYQGAGSLFDGLIENPEAPAILKVYAGHCALENGDADKGIRLLSTIADDEPFFIDAQWYLAGCLIRKDQTAEATQILEKLSQTEKIENYPYPIEKLLKKLQK